jgi:hypothetical protein
LTSQSLLLEKYSLFLMLSHIHHLTSYLYLNCLDYFIVILFIMLYHLVLIVISHIFQLLVLVYLIDSSLLLYFLISFILLLVLVPIYLTHTLISYFHILISTVIYLYFISIIDSVMKFIITMKCFIRVYYLFLLFIFQMLQLIIL